MSRIKRRIAWHPKANVAKAHLLGSQHSFFRWDYGPRKLWAQETLEYVEREVWQLKWDGLYVQNFDNEVDLKLYIIRFVYSMGDAVLIPSELLQEAGLWYSDGSWIESFSTVDLGKKIEAFRDGFPGEVPKDKKIRLGAGRPEKPPRTDIRRVVRAALGPLLVLPFALPPKKVVPELPDEACVFVIPVGKSV